LSASSTAGSVVARLITALGQPAVAPQVDREPAPGTAEAAPGGRDAHGGEPLDRHAVAVQRALEALVLERLARLEPADLRVGRGGDGERGTAELVVLARTGADERRVALDGIGLAAQHGGGRQALRGQVHALAAGVADAGVGGFDHVQRHRARGLSGPFLGGVGAAVEHEHDLVGGLRYADLGGERGDARTDQLLLVARGDDHARSQGVHGSGAPPSTRSRPAS
jgi:hypothetical protein